MRRIPTPDGAWSWWLVAILAFAPRVAHAQSSGDDEAKESTESRGTEPASKDATRGRRVRFEKVDGAVVRPEGWVDAESGKGALATFRATSDPDAQIEVRASSSIPEDRRASFFNSFHSKLKRAGFSEVRAVEKTTYGPHDGSETEYEGTSRDGTFRLVIWTHYRDETAWIFAGFFPAEGRDKHYKAFRKLAASLTTEQAD